jgi:hypothetical protein
MDTDIYRTPGSTLARETAGDAQFYVISNRKLVILFWATFGTHQVYWFFQNWKLQKQYAGISVFPMARAIFAIFFVQSLFSIMDREARKTSAPPIWSPYFWSTFFIANSVASAVLSQAAQNEVAGGITLLLSVVTSIATLYAIYRAQAIANHACGDPDGDSNSQLTAANYVLIVLGGVLWGLMLLGSAAVIAEG